MHLIPEGWGLFTHPLRRIEHTISLLFRCSRTIHLSGRLPVSEREIVRERRSELGLALLPGCPYQGTPVATPPGLLVDLKELVEQLPLPALQHKRLPQPPAIRKDAVLLDPSLDLVPACEEAPSRPGVRRPGHVTQRR